MNNQNIKFIKIISCPFDHAPLMVNDGVLKCEQCHKDFPISDKIVDFIGSDISDETKRLNSDYHDLEADYYDNIHLHMANENKVFRRVIKDIEHSDKVLLDVCTGTGFVLRNLSKIKKIFCLDISKKILERTVDLNGDKIIMALRGDVENLPVASNSIDIITISSALHHLPNYLNCLQEFTRVLKPGGHCIIFHEPHNFPQHSFLYNLFAKLSRYLLIMNKASELRRREKIAKMADEIFGLGPEESLQKMVEMNQLTHVHDGFTPSTLLNGIELELKTFGTYYGQDTLYHNIMSFLFPEAGELFYIVAQRK